MTKPNPDIGELARQLCSAKIEFDTCEAEYISARETLATAAADFDQAAADLRQRTGNGQDGPVAVIDREVVAAAQRATNPLLSREGRHVGDEWSAADWLDAQETDIPGSLKQQLERALAETAAENHIKLGKPEYSRRTPGEGNIPGPPKDMGDVILVVATAKVEEVLEIV